MFRLSPAFVFLVVAAAADLDTARQLIKDDKIVEALAEIRVVLANTPDDPEVQYQAGELLRQLGADRATRLEQLAPGSPDAHELVGRSLESRGRLDEALEEYRSALNAPGSRAGIHFLIGNVLWKKRDFEGALRELETELRLNPNHGLAQLRVGQVLLQLDQPDAAAGHLLAALSADPSSVDAHQSLGKAYRSMGRHREALREFEIVAAHRPDDMSIHAQLGGEYRAIGDLPRARAEMELQRRLLDQKAAAARKAQRSTTKSPP